MPSPSTSDETRGAVMTKGPPVRRDASATPMPTVADDHEVTPGRHNTCQPRLPELCHLQHHGADTRALATMA
jgi:hypothetical protein